MCSKLPELIAKLNKLAKEQQTEVEKAVQEKVNNCFNQEHTCKYLEVFQ